MYKTVSNFDIVYDTENFIRLEKTDEKKGRLFNIDHRSF